jgi:tetratricopeptide (TPR) repeat protein
MRLIDALNTRSDVWIWQIVCDDSTDRENWEVERLPGEVLHRTEENSGSSFIVKAINILPDGTTKDCYLNVFFPERDIESAYFVCDGALVTDFYYRFDGEIIPAVPIDCFGEYYVFHSKRAPEIGIEILKRGLKISPRKHFIAEDLGYILRDENRYKEAAEMFQIAVDEGPTTEFIYKELADCYNEIGELELWRKYQQLFDDSECGTISRKIDESMRKFGHP